MNERAIGKVVNRAREIETFLESIGATGKGLHEKISSVQHIIEPKLQKQLRWLASVRNNVVHNHYSDIDFNDFDDVYQKSMNQLRELIIPNEDLIVYENVETLSPRVHNFRKNHEGFVNTGSPKQTFFLDESSEGQVKFRGAGHIEEYNIKSKLLSIAFFGIACIVLVYIFAIVIDNKNIKVLKDKENQLTQLILKIEKDQLLLQNLKGDYDIIIKDVGFFQKHLFRPGEVKALKTKIDDLEGLLSSNIKEKNSLINDIKELKEKADE